MSTMYSVWKRGSGAKALYMEEKEAIQHTYITSVVANAQLYQ